MRHNYFFMHQHMFKSLKISCCGCLIFAITTFLPMVVWANNDGASNQIRTYKLQLDTQGSSGFSLVNLLPVPLINTNREEWVIVTVKNGAVKILHSTSMTNILGLRQWFDHPATLIRTCPGDAFDEKNCQITEGDTVEIPAGKDIYDLAFAFKFVEGSSVATRSFQISRNLKPLSTNETKPNETKPNETEHKRGTPTTVANIVVNSPKSTAQDTQNSVDSARDLIGKNINIHSNQIPPLDPSSILVRIDNTDSEPENSDKNIGAIDLSEGAASSENQDFTATETGAWVTYTDQENRSHCLKNTYSQKILCSSVSSYADLKRAN